MTKSSLSGPPSELPLVTFAVLSFNQEAYIGEAIRSALAQTYSRLEILVSDDASDDRSNAIAEELTSRYTGSHSVLTYRNPKNLGIGAHVNQIFRRAKGELVILAGGDDISHPERTEKVVQSWIDSGQQASSIFCGANKIDRRGKHLGPARTELESGNFSPEHFMLFKNTTRSLAIGACGAYSKEVMRRFGDLDADLPIEDIPLLIRSSMLGGVRYIPELLVDYRTSVSVWRERKPVNDNFSLRVARRKFYTRARLSVASQVLKDALSSKNDSYICAASMGYILHNFVERCCRKQSMRWHSWLRVAVATQNWRYSLSAAVMDGHPSVHRLLFNCKRALSRLPSFFSRLLRT